MSRIHIGKKDGWSRQPVWTWQERQKYVLQLIHRHKTGNRVNYGFRNVVAGEQFAQFVSCPTNYILRTWQLSPSHQKRGESIYKHRTLIPHCRLGVPLINTIRECRTDVAHKERGVPLPVSLIPPVFGLQIEIQACDVWIMNYSICNERLGVL